ncbi:DUF6441 family protein [Parvibaculum sp.]|uniref:DUF6441 family protein n=1 Tax=Parvibaculum sp. TaxID=2024848 RepID=UPI001DEEDDEA|nr:DUF6441 family protein [Parvibaculum sp.]MBX3488870.1 hypothetical protein [Parvibaculum sp.]
MRLKLAVDGDLVATMDDWKQKLRVAVTDSIDEVAEEARQKLKAQTDSAGLGKVSRTWRKKRYPSRPSLGAAAMIWSKAPEIVAAFDAGITIVPKMGRYLAIPTGFNRQGGRRASRGQRGQGGWAGVRVTPQEMIASGLAFVRPRGNGKPGLIWFLKVARAQRRSKAGRVSDLAYAGGLVQVGGRSRRRIKGALEAGAVPMFVLVPRVRLDKRLSVARVAHEASARLPRVLRHRIAKIGDAV